MASIEQWRDDALVRLRSRRSQLAGRARYGLRPPRRDRTAVVTDSAAALPGAVLGHGLAAGIRQVALPVMVGEQIHTEGTDELALELPLALAAGTPVRTSRPSPGAFRTAYAELAHAGYARILSVHLSGELSGTVEAARVAAADAERPVTVVDSRTVGFALGMAVVDAAVDAGVGMPVARIRERLEATVDSSHVLFTVPSLEQLRRGGRISGLASLLGTLLQVRPVMAVDDGAIGLVDRPRSAARAVDRLVELATERAGEDPVRIAVHEYGDPETAVQLAERLQPISTTPVPVVELPAVLAAHLGLGALGVVICPLESPPGGAGD